MPAAISMDLRKRTVAAYVNKATYVSVANTLDVGVATVNRWLRRVREVGSATSRAHAGGRTPQVDASGEIKLRELVDLQPDATLDELSVLLSTAVGRAISRNGIFSALKRMGITRKKR